MAERRAEVSCEAQKKSGPRVRVGQRQRGPSSTPIDEEGFIYGVLRTPKGSERPDIVKECEQTAPIYE